MRHGTSFGLSPLFFLLRLDEISYTAYHYHLSANDKCVWKFLYSLCFSTRQNSQLFFGLFLSEIKTIL